jgi:hypothetical protein
MLKKQTGLRLDEPTLARVDLVARVMSERSGGLNATRSEVARVALLEGLPMLEARLGIASEAPAVAA